MAITQHRNQVKHVVLFVDSDFVCKIIASYNLVFLRLLAIFRISKKIGERLHRSKIEVAYIQPELPNRFTLIFYLSDQFVHHEIQF